jgi:hypothetical protein
MQLLPKDRVAMKVLVACEFSGIVRDAFIRAGHDAISADLLPSERPGPHFQGDVIDLLYRDGQPIHEPFSLVIAHPPCTYLSLSGVRWLYGGKGTVRDEDRWDKMLDAARFFEQLLHADVERIAVENPIQHRHAGLPKPTQIVQPYQFGTPETKATALWLKGLPPLVPTNVVDGRTPRVHHASPGPDRWKDRSRTDPNIAAAMAAQWATGE